MDIKSVLKSAKATKPAKKKEEKDKKDEAPTKRNALSFIKNIAKSGK